MITPGNVAREQEKDYATKCQNIQKNHLSPQITQYHNGCCMSADWSMLFKCHKFPYLRLHHPQKLIISHLNINTVNLILKKMVSRVNNVLSLILSTSYNFKYTHPSWSKKSLEEFCSTSIQIMFKNYLHNLKQ